jgi:hypothetical protein
LAHGAALMLRSYWTLRAMDKGFSTTDVLTLTLRPSGPRYTQFGVVGAFFEEAIRRVEALPGVTRAAAISRLPLEGGDNSTAIIEGRDPGLGRGPLVETRPITSGYFDAMGIHLLSGRALGPLDSTPDIGIGAAIGLVVALLSAKMAAGLVYGFRPNDPVTVAAGGCLPHRHRAGRLADPGLAGRQA